MVKSKRRSLSPFLIALTIILTITSVLFVGTNFMRHNTQVGLADDDLSNPSSWASWTQYNGAWGKAWGGVGSNGGCYLTSIAIQGARGGMTKTSKGQPWNPLNLSSAIGAGQCGSTAGDNGFKMKQCKGNLTSSCTAGTAIGSPKKVIDDINDLTHAGLFPIIHIDGASGAGVSTHYMAFRKMDGNTLTIYDPALINGQNTIDREGGQDKFLSHVAWVEGWGGSPKNYSQADSPAQKGAKGQKDEGKNGGNVDSSGNDNDKNGNVNGYGSGAPIHVEFNPFRTQMNQGAYTQVGANTDITPLNNSVIMSIRGANWFGLLQTVERFCAILMVVLLAYYFCVFTLLMADNFGATKGKIQGLLGLIGDRVPLINRLFFPKGVFLGISESSSGSSVGMIGKFVVEIVFLIVVFTLCCTGSLSLIASHIFSLMNNVPF